MKRSMMVLGALALLGPRVWADPPSARFGHSMVSIDDSVYVFGGHSPTNPVPQNDLWQYQPEAYDWAEIVAQDPPPERHSHTATAVDGKMYVYGGLDGRYQPMGDMWVYEPSANTWTQVSTGSVPARGFHSATAVGDQIVIFGGLDHDQRPSTDTWVYSTTSGTWERGQNFPDLGYGDTGAAYNDSVYVLGHTEGLAYVYDVTQNSWSEVPIAGGGGGGPGSGHVGPDHEHGLGAGRRGRDDCRGPGRRVGI